jgi:ppGpp synthetase/RelA/SpoT-type nucleotidyltranferase
MERRGSRAPIEIKRVACNNLCVDVEKIVADYRAKFPLHEGFTSQMKHLLTDLLSAEIRDFAIEGRTKDPEHFRGKIIRPGKSYVDPLSEVTDLTGLRIIVQRVADANRVIQLIEREFEIDRKNSVFREDRLSVDQFGYSASNLVVRLTPTRVMFSEWTRYSGLKAEIQVRTILQDAWARVSRRFDYESEMDMPRALRRRLFRLSALFELAEDELNDLVEKISAEAEAYRNALSIGNISIEINVDSLRVYVEQSPEVRYWNDFLAREIKVSIDGIGDLSRDVRIAEFCGLRTIGEIETVLAKAHGWGADFFLRFYREFFSRYTTDPTRVSVQSSGPVTMLLIASYIEKFTQEILLKDFGWGTTFIIEAAKASRGIA